MRDRAADALCYAANCAHRLAHSLGRPRDRLGSIQGHLAHPAALVELDQDGVIPIELLRHLAHSYVLVLRE